MIAILAEKPSVAKDIARVLGANQFKDGYKEGNGYMVTWAFGHLAVLAPPEMYGSSKIPIIPGVFKLVSRREKTVNGYQPDKAALKQLKVIKLVFEKCESIIVATDAAREGEATFRNIYRLLECDKPFSRRETSLKTLGIIGILVLPYISGGARTARCPKAHVTM